MAVGGATAHYVPGERSPSLLAQVGLYSDTIGRPIESDALRRRRAIIAPA